MAQRKFPDQSSCLARLVDFNITVDIRMAHNGGRAMPQDLEFIMQMVHGDPAAPAGPSVAAVDGAQAVEVVAAPELKETE